MFSPPEKEKGVVYTRFSSNNVFLNLNDDSCRVFSSTDGDEIKLLFAKDASFEIDCALLTIEFLLYALTEHKITQAFEHLRFKQRIKLQNFKNIRVCHGKHLLTTKNVSIQVPIMLVTVHNVAPYQVANCSKIVALRD